MENVPEVEGASLGWSSCCLPVLCMALAERLGMTNVSAVNERLTMPIDGHMCRCAMITIAAFNIDVVTDIVTFRHREVLA